MNHDDGHGHGYGYGHDAKIGHDARTGDDALTEGVPLRRVWAWLIDFVLIAVLAAVLWVILFAFGLFTFGLGMSLLGLLPLVPVAYHCLFVMMSGATPGQSFMGLTVRRNEDLGPPDFARAALFTLGLYVTLVAGVVWLAVAFFTLRRRTLHDILAGVVVVRRRALTSAPGFGNMGQGTPYA